MPEKGVAAMEVAYRERWKTEIGFNEYYALDFFQGALLKDPRKVLVQRVRCTLAA
jgi:zona occludens toxin (predicted ATPase)